MAKGKVMVTIKAEIYIKAVIKRDNAHASQLLHQRSRDMNKNNCDCKLTVDKLR